MTTLILYAGTNHCVTKAYLDELLEDASAGDFMLIQNEINCLNEAMEIAHKKKMYIAFNPSPISKELFTLPLSYVDWWFCNEIEGAILFGKNQKQKMADQIAMDPEKIMQQFQKQYPQPKARPYARAISVIDELLRSPPILNSKF